LPLAAASFYYGPGRAIAVKSMGVETIAVGGRQRGAEKFVVTYRGGRTDRTFEMWLSTDARRVPMLVKLPTTLAIFSAELE
jgi:hypothetical protein